MEKYVKIYDLKQKNMSSTKEQEKALGQEYLTEVLGESQELIDKLQIEADRERTKLKKSKELVEKE